MAEINGTAGNDTLYGTMQDDVVQGLGGNDRLHGEEGQDELLGGIGDDTLYGDDGDDTLIGNSGDDNLIAGFGDDLLIGGVGNDRFSDRGGNDVAMFEEEFDSLDFTINGYRLTIQGDYTDTVYWGIETLVFAGVSYSFSHIASIAERDWIERSGTEGADQIYGSHLSERIDAKGGDDYVDAEWGDDTLYGGAGNDWLSGERDNDVLIGGEGADQFSIRAGKWLEGDDVISDFERGTDQLYFWLEDILREEPEIMGLSGDPELLELSDLDDSADWAITASADGDVKILHESGSVELDGIALDETWDRFTDLADVFTIEGTFIPVGTVQAPDDPPVITGNPWGEWLKGTAEADSLDALGGNDVVRGYDGADSLNGGAGDDTLRGEAGDDVLTGGLGADTFAIRAGKWGEGNDVITDFQADLDTVDLKSADILKASPHLASLSGDFLTIEASDFDASADWTLEASANGNLLIVHPSGSIELTGIGYGGETDSFADLLSFATIDGASIPAGTTDVPPAPETPTTIAGNPWGEWMKGTGKADKIDAAAGDDVLRGYAGDDTLIGGTGDDTLRGEQGSEEMTGGDGADIFRIRSGKWDQGDDVVTDFELGADKLVFAGSDMLKKNAGLDGAAGDPNVLDLDDLDADGDFTLAASADGDLLIGHQTGTVELNGIAYGQETDSFVELANYIEIDVA